MTQPDPSFESLLQYLRESRGFDFTGYKRSSLTRRVRRRMAQVEVPEYNEYLDYLQVHPEEFTALFNTILINVTGFFRDPEAWEYLRGDVLAKIVAAADRDAPLRIWSAGCASGEEAYSLAMMVAEAVGPDEFRRRVKIYATDVDEESLARARHATYGAREVSGLPAELLENYFESGGGRYTFRKDLRRSVVFGRNDVVRDAPISRVDLLVCRNVLMYFNAETQARILSRFHFALTNSGVLFLGRSEMLLGHADLFVPIDVTRRLFRKVAPHQPGTGAFLVELADPPPRDELTGLDRLRDEAFTAGPVAQVVITANGLVALTNRRAETMFGVSTSDVGRPFRDLDLSCRPVELRGYIERAQVEHRTTRVPDVEYVRAPGETLHLEVQVNPLVDTDAGLLGVALIFVDVTTARRLHDELEHANRQLETAYEELQATNEELETTNEELQSTVEELETTNEALVGERTAERDHANAFLEAIVTSLGGGPATRAIQLNAIDRRGRGIEVWVVGAPPTRDSGRGDE